MQTILRLHEIDEASRQKVGGKALALAVLARAGWAVPRAICVGAHVYETFLEVTGLRARIAMEYERKPFDQMRWEEIWDTALRIQSLFINTELPTDIATALRADIGREFARLPVVVRSSALGEDSQKASFAGLHDSFVNIRGIAAILQHIKLVWASLWSDRAMLYRSEIGLDIEESKMAVIVQELVVGEKSGIVFGLSPTDESKAVVEAVHGLNQGLVDGTIEPDRWLIDRKNGTIQSHTIVARDKMVVAKRHGIAVTSLAKQKQGIPPLTKREVAEVFHSNQALEHLFGLAQDTEWTYRGTPLYLLQSRPITTAQGISQEDKRPWYLSLHRSLENLAALRRDIETRYIPKMISVAKTLSDQDLKALDTEALANAIGTRKELYVQWRQVYWDYFIPFAHAVRLFGQTYNRVVKPQDPYEFARLLPGALLKSVARNRKLSRVAATIRNRPGRQTERVEDNEGCAEDQREALAKAARNVDSSTLQALLSTVSIDKQLTFFEELAKTTPKAGKRKRGGREALTRNFVEAFPPHERKHAEQLLDLARASYQWRDDDNIYLGRIESELLRALVEVKRRSRKAAALPVESANADQFIRALTDPAFRPSPRTIPGESKSEQAIKARQLIGQPAGEGVAVGSARVVRRPEDLLDFKRGEILVCDAVDPNMTFVVPLAAGVVERRGGMLIHGAIIAREYGLPCVTGVPDVSTVLRTGDRITVDGYLGIVTIGSATDNPDLSTLANPRPRTNKE